MLMRPVTLSEILGVLRDTYEGADIRSLLINNEGNWICTFLKIRLTNEPRAAVEAKYANKVQDLGEIKSDKVRFEFEYRGINDLDQILLDVQNNRFTVNGVQCVLKSTSQNLQTNKISEDNDVTTEGEKSGFPHVFLNNPMEMSVRNLLKSCGITDPDLGRNFEELYSFYDVRDLGASNSVVLLIPIYCKKIAVPYDDRKTSLSKYQIHQNLLSKVKVRLLVKKGASVEFTENAVVTPKPKDNGICEVDVPMTKRQLGPDHQISIQIQNDVLDKVSLENIDARDLKDILRHDDKLIGIFSQFEASKNLTLNLLSVQEFPQLGSTMALLALLGFRCAPLGLTGKPDEKIMLGSQEVGSADLLAYNEDLRIMLIIDCTRTIPDDTKLGRIRNTCIHIGKTLGLEVMPVVVSSVDCSSASPKAKSLNILLIDATCTNKLSKLILSGQKDAAITLLRGYIQNAKQPKQP